jgi:uncharacterized protein (DUF2126 family)/transglutaminase-like putative cysteine protease
MSIHVALHHQTTYRYNKPISVGPQLVRLRPAPHARTPILSYSLQIEPKSHFMNWQQDPTGNYIARLVFPEKTDIFRVSVDLVADMAVINPFDFFLEPAAEKFPFTYDPSLAEELAPYRKVLPRGRLLDNWIQSIDLTPRPTVDFLMTLNQRLLHEIGYVIRLEPGVQTPEETLQKKLGSCRDSGWLLVQILRHLGFAARFVSGYLIQLVADEKSLDGPSGTDRDFTDLHAWCEVYLPGAGWIGLDPTSGLMAGEGHIPLACTPEPQSAAPIDGLTEKAEVDFDFAMKVTRIYESPRVTKPYDEQQWHTIVELGRKVDTDLARNDVRLTMGGEPTFVSIDDMDGPEWNTDALGENKRRLAGRLFRRLADRFAKQPLLHYGQGKWYPGEQLPRWALSCVWRNDGQPMWNDPELWGKDDKPSGATAATAQKFAQSLARRLDLNPNFAIPAYEDAWYYLWRERRLPLNVDAHESHLRDPLERARLAKIFEQGIDAEIGYVLPIQRAYGNGRRWTSGPWFLRPERLYLIPGDSPIGYRLPLDSLPWVVDKDYPYQTEVDPLAPRLPFPPRQSFERRAAPTLPQGTPGRAEQRLPPQRGESAPWVVRTAMTIEPRNGHLYIFMPPTPNAEDYLDLLVAVEPTAAELKQPVFIEGYLPPGDPRLAHFSVTPDPGVIEVNIHPSKSWDEMLDRTTAVYEEARACRLGTEKFMLDGRHVGTGGGNHMTLGGTAPEDSPFLRRPDLLKSMVGYWLNHPSLSYLFSGLFIGPTSQHPRVDEARNDAVYELEIAFQQIKSGQSAPPWLVDRIFRNLLIDVTGNTHRAEFCIDKMFSPDSASGRRGLLELRAFEMPPHSRMSLTQQLLLRALLARFWRRPYEEAPIRWHTRLHDDFMLPHFVGQDFADVLADLNLHGYDFKREWFAPHFEFRFPEIGKVAYSGIELELRHALEPWHVLGEEGAVGGTVRYVDSSVERMQIKLEGLVDPRHRVVVNGRQLPLRSTGVMGQYVAGLRYRAWRPPEALHPTIDVHAPLVFDIFDSWNGRSIGGCTYHVAHPGGRNYQQFPVNANAAEARRRARFFPIGHSQGVLAPHAEQPAPEHPLTLDLRWHAKA